VISKETISPELKFILDSLKGNPGLSTEGLHQDVLLSLIQDHRIIGQIHRNFNENIDPSLYVKLTDQNSQNKMYQLKLIQELGHISQLFNDIPFISLKGPLLSQQLYNDPAERTSRDLDILIDESNLDEAVKRLVGDGYELLTEYNTPKQKEAILKNFHHVELFNRHKQIVVEVHWNLTTFRKVRVNIENIKARAESIDIAGNTLYTLNRADQLGYLCVHGVFHTYFRLQWLIDLKTLLESLSESELIEMKDYLKKEGLIEFYLITVQLLARIFDYNLSPDEKTQFASVKHGDKLVEMCIRQIIDNNSMEQGPQRRGGYINMIRNHKVQYYAGGVNGLLKNMFSRNVRPENWKIYAFPDRFFGLNHVFSRLIALFGKLKNK
jgi:hypothetical protein